MSSSSSLSTTSQTAKPVLLASPSSHELLRGVVSNKHSRNNLIYLLSVLWSIFIFVSLIAVTGVFLRFPVTNSINTAVTTVLSNTGVSFGQSPVGGLNTAVQQLQTIADMTQYAQTVNGVASVGLHNVLLGGIRLAQSRFSVGPCPGTPSMYNKVLVNGATLANCVTAANSYSAFGIGTQPQQHANNTLLPGFLPRASSGKVTTSWLGTDSPADDFPFFIVLPYSSQLTAQVSSLLNTYNWFNKETQVAELFFVLLNGNQGAWTLVSATFVTSLGGQIIANLNTITLYTLPFVGTQQAVYGLDALNTFNLVVLWILLVGSIVYHFYRLHKSQEKRRYFKEHIFTLRVLGSWIIELIVAGLLTATAASFAGTISRMKATESMISNADWTPLTFENDTVNFHTSVSTTAQQYNVMVLLAILTAVAMAIKIIFSFSFGRRLGTFHRAFGRAMPDLIAAGLLVVLVMMLFGFVGQCVYAGSIVDWSVPLSAGLALFRELNGEGPTSQMIATAPSFTPIFYGSFYVIVQSTLLVVLFAIVSDSYSTVRNEQAEELEEAKNGEAAELASPGIVKRMKRGAFGDLFDGFTFIPAALLGCRRRLCGSRRSMKPGLLGPAFLCCAVGPSAKLGDTSAMWSSACCCCCHGPAAVAAVAGRGHLTPPPGGVPPGVDSTKLAASSSNTLGLDAGSPPASAVELVDSSNKSKHHLPPVIAETPLSPTLSDAAAAPESAFSDGRSTSPAGVVIVAAEADSASSSAPSSPASKP